MLGIIACIVVAVWLLPICIKAKIQKKTILRIILGLLIGAIPVAAVAVYCNIMIGAKVFGDASMTVELYCLLNSLSVGFVEETAKLLGALVCVLFFKSNRKIDYILAFAAVGAGFEIMETFAYSDNVISSLPRIILALHVVWLLYDGAGYYDMKNGKPLALIKAYVLTVILHAMYDCGLMMLQHSDVRESVLLLGFLVTIVGIGANIIIIFRTLKMVKKAIKTSRND